MTVCPFCARDPFHYVDNGIGMEPVAVTCCENGDLFFRGKRSVPDEVTLTWDEFVEIGRSLAALRQQNSELEEKLGAETVNNSLSPLPADCDHSEKSE